MSYSIKLKSNGTTKFRGGVEELEIFNTKTGDKIKNIQSLTLEFNVDNQCPIATIKFIPDNINIEMLHLETVRRTDES